MTTFVNMNQTINELFCYRFDQELTDVTSFKTIKAFKQFLEKVIVPLNKYIKYTWQQMKKLKNRGPRYHPVLKNTLSKKSFKHAVNLSEDESIYQIALDLKERVYGIIVDKYFVIISYDPGHKGNSR